jgi:hypothetical protein
VARELNARQEAFAQAVVLNGGDKVAARLEAGYAATLAKHAQGVDADKLFNHRKISVRIKELQEKADKVANEKFDISVEQRLKWLDEIVQAGLGTYTDQQGNQRREALSAADKAINTMNAMLGTKEGDETTDSMEITFNVVDARRHA